MVRLNGAWLTVYPTWLVCVSATSNPLRVTSLLYVTRGQERGGPSLNSPRPHARSMGLRAAPESTACAAVRRLPGGKSAGQVVDLPGSRWGVTWCRQGVSALRGAGLRLVPGLTWENARMEAQRGGQHMANQSDSRPVFTIVMGCSGVGKSAWKRHNRDQLPERYFDRDSLAGGIGDWNSESARRRARTLVDAEILSAIEAGTSYGMENTCPGSHGVERLCQAIEAGYRVEGIYLGTASPAINVERIHRRVLRGTGRRVDPALVPERYKLSLFDLRRAAARFDQLRVLDNSRHDPMGIPAPVEQCFLERGDIIRKLPEPEMMPWCQAWVDSLPE